MSLVTPTGIENKFEYAYIRHNSSFNSKRMSLFVTLLRLIGPKFYAVGQDY
jgi:hypothetical protein